MRYMKFGTVSAAIIFAASASFADAGADASMLAWDGDDYATSELGSGDWSKAEAALLGSDVAPEDAVFAKINLAFVYSSTGRKDLAMNIYQEILEGKANPYALTVSGQPRRVKTIAKVALARLEDQ
ncbi:hypothetical protein ACFO5Q_09310 [Kordiimonas lipolytica]|uniref:Tetratricopeptide repeat-containing protein n=1 Tax=Kordiimonas lipolytica TaxID=1662421 RepID=A0ABV8UBI7_9PROT|nr:hypothetical protein [Kordiimonas lipolytica]